MYEDLCFRFDNETDDQRDGGRGGGEGGRGGRRRGGRRGPAAGGRDRRRGSEMFDDRSTNRTEQVEGWALRRYTSAESLNRGHRGHRERPWRGREGSAGRWGRDEERGYDRRPRDGYGGGERGRFENLGERLGRGGGWRGGGRGGGGRGGVRSFQLRHFSDLTDPADVTLKLISKISEFEDFLTSDSISTNETSEVLRILGTVLDCDMHRESVLIILNTICKSRFLDNHLIKMFLSPEASPADGLFRKEQQNVEMICKLISHICSRLPTYASKGYLLLISLTCQAGVMAAVRRNQILEEEVKDLMARCQKIMKMAQDPAEKKQSGRKTIGPNEDDETPPDDFTKLSIFPTGQDMEWNEKPFLRANKTDGGYKDVNHYLDVQFRLLREDYIRPLRKGIREYKIMKEKGESLKKNPDLRLYHNVKVIGLACKDSLEHRIQFDNSHLKNIRWESSKRLMYGSLVSLSRDDFQNTFFAVVTSREMKDIKHGILQVRFMNSIREILNASGDTFIMAETTAYFEAYRHVLEGLQEMQTCFPLARYIVECKTDIKPPQYARGYGTSLNIRYLLKDECRQNTQVSALLPTRWPPVENTPFNQSQYDAVKTALTKEIAIIQGPPGTGKTYVGLKVAKVLLDNRDVWTSNAKPMLVVCYTNHALDQFLEGILEFCPDGIVRVGSRCKNEQLERFNLKEIRSQIRKAKRVKLDIRNSINDCFRGLCTLRERVERVSARLEATAKGILGENALRSAMPDNHYMSLVRNNTLRGFGPPQSVMIKWLTQGMLGESDETSFKGLEQEVTQQILEGTEMQHELSIDASQIPFLHPKMKAQMYRYWVDKVQNRLNQTLSATVDVQTKQKLLVWRSKCTQEILPDNFLKQVINSNVFRVIAETSAQSPWYHKDYCVKTWLGLTPDTMSLQNLLDQLLEEDEGDEAEDKLNVEEDAEYLQRERQLDDADDNDDDNLFDFARRHKYSVKDAITDLGIVTTVGKGGDRDPSGWQMPKAHRKQQERRLQHLLKASQAMSEKEALAITDVWSHRLQMKDRVRLYLFWLDRYQTSLKDSMKKEADIYETESARMRELKFAEDRDIMRSKTVIGMTTTGAARYRSVLKSIGCPIVLLEEAAEVLEAHVVTTLSESCQHLILIGDHQQLRPSPTVYELSKFYNLDISLFERLIKNQLHHTTLTLQHRMKPEIANFVRHVYPHLKDHVTTVNRKRIRGVKQDVFLLHHEFGETRTNETSSKLNDHEADFCLCLCRYLLQQGYTTSQITILTGYSGQVFALKSRMKKETEFFKGVRVTAVDNYQGEENDIIILSLVRSNEEGNVGFLGTDNRVCVALSRARDGLYAIGNFRILADKSELWKNIAKTAKSNQQLGDYLVLRCENHPTTETKVSNKDDFQNVPEGGCRKPCIFRLTCGHVCERLCHGYDMDHKEYQCMKKCGRPVCPKGHLCLKKCYEPCGKCIQRVEKVIPMCGHKAMMECHRDPHTLRCTSRCEGNLEKCGHQCSGKCGQCRETRSHVGQCTQEVERVWPCGHLIKSPCHASPATWPCPQLCGVILDCGHRCKGTCGECLGGLVHKACEEVCGKILSGCSHKCRLPCGSKCLPCKEKPCLTRCKHSRCPLVCGEPCKPCEERCPWKCEHVTCQSFCHTPCQPCGKKCLKILKCGHLCSGFCGEMCLCYTCEKEQFIALAVQGLLSKEECVQVHDTTILVKLPECKHIFRADALDAYVQRKRFTPGTFLVCPGCAKPLKDWECWRYHSILRRRRQDEDKKKTILKDSTLVSKVRQYKIIKSMDMLTSSKQDPRSFAYIALRRNLETADLDVNKCFALTNQIKLARMIEMVDQLFLQIRNIRNLERNSISDLQDDIESLKRLVLPPVDNMSEQRRQELTSETRRLVYTMLLTSLKGIPSYYLLNSTNTMSSLQKQADQLLKTLKTKKKEIIPMAECERVIEEAREKNSTYQLETACVDLSILGASPEVDLCDIGKVSGQSLSSRIRALQLIRMHIDD